MSNVEQVVDNLIEVELQDRDAFLKIAETLTRIGVAVVERHPGGARKLYQSCHILHKRGRYYIVHFKEMFALDGLHSTMNEDDERRTLCIAKLLEQWGLLKIVSEHKEKPMPEFKNIKVLAHKEKNEWQLEPKYTIGSKRRVS